MQESEIKEPKELRVNTITAIATAVLAFISVIGLILALTEFIERRNKILGITGSTLIVIVITIGLIVTILILKRWIKNG